MPYAGKRTLYLHIGQAKTASSTIQHFLLHNREALATEGFLFPVIEDSPHALSKDRPWANARLLYHALTSAIPESPKQVWERYYLPRIENSDAHSIILSDELFSFADASVLDALDLSAFDVRIVVYIRPSVEYLASAWAQAVRSRFYKNLNGSLSLAEFLEQDYDTIDTLHSYIGRFGKDRIILRPLETAQLHEGDACADFLRHIGAPAAEYRRIADKNPSLGRDLAEAAYCINMLDLPLAEHTRLKSRLFSPLISTPKIMETLDDDTIRRITDKNAPKESALAQLLLGRPNLFLAPYPAMYGKERPAYSQMTLPLEKWEILTEAARIGRNRLPLRSPAGRLRRLLDKILK